MASVAVRRLPLLGSGFRRGVAHIMMLLRRVLVFSALSRGRHRWFYYGGD